MLKLLAFSKKRQTDLVKELENQDRKKSQNMTFATSAAEDVLKNVDPTLLDSLDIIFCTGEGEIAQTFEFYKNLANGERARPLVFQNSLHNSTLGALSLAIPNISSGITVSNGDVSSEMALNLALATHSPRPILIIGADVYVDKVIELRQDFYGKNVEVTSGACAALFIPDTHPLYQTIKAPVLESVDINMHSPLTAEVFPSYYPASGLEAICEKLMKETSFKLSRPPHYQVHINA